MEKSLELIAKEVLREGGEQAKVVLLALAVYELLSLGKRALGIASGIKL